MEEGGEKREKTVGGNREGSDKGKRGKEEEKERGIIAATGKITICLIAAVLLEGRVSFLDVSLPGNQIGDW